MAEASRSPLWRRRLLPAVLILLGLNLVVLVVYTMPRSWRLKSVASRAGSLREEVERERRQTADLRQRVDTVTRNARDVERFYREYVQPREEAFLPTVQDVEAMAREPGLTAGRRAYAREEVKGASITRVMINVPLSGTYEQLVGFLERVERGIRFLTVDRVAIRRNPGDGGGQAQLTVELSAYFKADAKAAGDRDGD